MGEGWIKLHRRISEHPVFQDSELLHLFIYCLLEATHRPLRRLIAGSEIVLNPGQFITGRKKIGSDLNISEPKARRKLETLERLGVISRRSISGQHGSVVTVLNWDTYQTDADESGQQMASKWPASGQQAATIQEQKNIDREIDIRASAPEQAIQNQTTGDTPEPPNASQQASGEADGASVEIIPPEIEQAAFETFGGTAPTLYLRQWLAAHPPGWIIEALKRTQAAGVRKTKYTDAILAGWKREGYPQEEKSENVRGLSGKSSRCGREADRPKAPDIGRTGDRFGT